MPIRFPTIPFMGLALAASIVASPLTGLHAQDQSAVPSVIVIEAAEQEITPVTRYPGRAEAVETVQLRARVEGFIEQRNFREGADVAKGDLLFVLEQEPYLNWPLRSQPRKMLRPISNVKRRSRNATMCLERPLTNRLPNWPPPKPTCCTRKPPFVRPILT